MPPFCHDAVISPEFAADIFDAAATDMLRAAHAPRAARLIIIDAAIAAILPPRQHMPPILFSCRRVAAAADASCLHYFRCRH